MDFDIELISVILIIFLCLNYFYCTMKYCFPKSKQFGDFLVFLFFNFVLVLVGVFVVS